MDFKSKHYKLKIMEYYIKEKRLFFLFDTTDFKNETWLEVEQTFKKSGLKFYKFNNTGVKLLLKKTILKNLKAVINGPLKLVYFEIKKKNIKITHMHQSRYNFQLYLIKLNNKIYSKLQLKNLNFFNYKTNLFLLKKSLKKSLFVKPAVLIKGSE